MWRKILIGLGVVLVALIGCASYGIKRFHDAWFKERPNYLTATLGSDSIPFTWATMDVDGYKEDHVALMVPVKVKGLPHKFLFQLDTGTPHSLLYARSLKSLESLGASLSIDTANTLRLVDQLELEMGNNVAELSGLPVKENYGAAFGIADTIAPIKIGTLGADILDNRITEINFKDQILQFFDERPERMSALPEFKPFSFEGRRFMLPVEIEGKKSELYYDSGCSAFGLIISKKLYDSYSGPKSKELKYSGNRWGESLEVCHRTSEQLMTIGNAEVPLNRVSYVNMYANVQHLLSPFTRIGGWLGNKPFLDHSLILDTRNNTFLVYEQKGKHLTANL